MSRLLLLLSAVYVAALFVADWLFDGLRFEDRWKVVGGAGIRDRLVRGGRRRHDRDLA